MQFPSQLIAGTLVQRYKRFLADVRLDNGVMVTATCPNTGSMMGLVSPGARVWLSSSDSLTRKYQHTWEMLEVDLGEGPVLVGINTGSPNKIVAEAIAAQSIEELAGYETLRREVRYGLNSRIDLLLESPSKGLCYVEIKNVHLMRKSGLAEFPDSRTERGIKHLNEMTEMVRQGHRAVMVYLVQRGDARELAFARDIDASYGAAFDEAKAGGVEAIAIRCRLSHEEIVAETRIPLIA